MSKQKIIEDAEQQAKMLLQSYHKITCRQIVMFLIEESSLTQNENRWVFWAQVENEINRILKLRQ